jgi:Ca2+-binding RTX toxin-like protein
VFAATHRVVVYANGGNDDVTIALNLGRRAELYGGAGNDRLRGGNRNDILVGGSGDDLLTGAAGRDILIGDDDTSAPLSIGGVDRLVGDDDDDVLIGGFTTWAGRRDALGAILAEWGGAHSYAQRVQNLRNGQGTPGVYANTNGFEDFFLVADVTVRDDLLPDTLTGSAGQDWFFANADGILRDRVSDLAAGEFADDLDFIFGL